MNSPDCLESTDLLICPLLHGNLHFLLLLFVLEREASQAKTHEVFEGGLRKSKGGSTSGVQESMYTALGRRP